MKVHLFFLLILLHSTLEYDIYTLSGSEKEISLAYKTKFINAVSELKVMLNESKIFEEVDNCVNGTNELYMKDPLILFEMFLNSGISSRSFGKFKSCIDLNNNTLNTSNFVVVEEFILENEKVLFGACIPFICNNLINSIENRALNYANRTLLVNSFPKNTHFVSETLPFEKIVSYIWIYLLLGYIVIVTLVNIFMSLKFRNINPYDLENLSSQSKNLTGGIYLRQNSRSENNLENEAFLQTDNLNYNNLDPRKLNCVKRGYYYYFSIENNLFLLSETKSSVFNDSKLRFFNGIIAIFSYLHVMSCVLDLLQIISKEDNLTKNSELRYNPFVLLFPLFKNFGKMWFEILATFWGLFICFKYLNWIELPEEDKKTKKIMFWILRHSDKFILFILVNLWFVNSIDYIMHTYFKDNITWFLFDKNAKECSFYNFLPFSDFYPLITSGDLTPRCMKSNSFVFQGFYILFFCLLVLNFINKSEKKLLILFLILILTLLIRTVASVMYTMNNSNSPTFTIEIFRAQFFFTLPNATLGIILGYVYYLDISLEVINNKSLFNYFSGFDKIRNAYVKEPVKNLAFIFSSLILIVYCGFINKIIEIEPINNSRLVVIFLLSLNGFITSLMMCSAILSIKLKGGGEVWMINQIGFIISKKLFSSKILLVISRCVFTINITHIGVTYFLVTFYIKNTIIFDFFTVFEMYGITVCFLVYVFSFIITLYIEIPFRASMKQLFSVK